MRSSEERMYIQSLSKLCKMQLVQKVVQLNSTGSATWLCFLSIPEYPFQARLLIHFMHETSVTKDSSASKERIQKTQEASVESITAKSMVKASALVSKIQWD